MYRGLAGVISIAFSLGGCSLIETPYSVRNPVIQGELKKGGTDPGTEDTTMLRETAQRWVDAYREVLRAKDPVAKKSAIYHFVDSGLTYSGLLCEDYFLTMKHTQAHRGFYQKEANLTSGLTSSLMGLAEASAGSIAATGAIFSFGSASFDSYNEAFLFSADLNTLESLVRANQSQQEVIIFKKLDAAPDVVAPNSILTLDQAIRELDKYTYTCTRGGIVALLNETVSDTAGKVRGNTVLKSKSSATPIVLENIPSNTTTLQIPKDSAPESQ
ncbi:hypothetical protein [Pseudomonas sp. GM17]|uniref:hypothetical protein n=1 Tax=Pseudomonas sp. GM17 TaxID=1144323 RepID=UPI00027255CE|nr:hypothetical protein [Pseudomonas sp. GM17]WIE48646.1 hypothetical protein PMI20_023275 [Pseudomonas sp. GM17]